jgi:hypothetical protein
MDTNTQVLRAFREDSSEAAETIVPIDALSRDDLRRSNANIIRWMPYLPEDCIRTMIAMGWDVST